MIWDFLSTNWKHTRDFLNGQKHPVQNQAAAVFGKTWWPIREWLLRYVNRPTDETRQLTDLLCKTSTTGATLVHMVKQYNIPIFQVDREQSIPGTNMIGSDILRHPNHKVSVASYYPDLGCIVWAKSPNKPHADNRYYAMYLARAMAQCFYHHAGGIECDLAEMNNTNSSMASRRLRLHHALTDLSCVRIAHDWQKQRAKMAALGCSQPYPQEMVLLSEWSGYLETLPENRVEDLSLTTAQQAEKQYHADMNFVANWLNYYQKTSLSVKNCHTPVQLVMQYQNENDEPCDWNNDKYARIIGKDALKKFHDKLKRHR